jgi:peptidoglycan/xylan/chitin deacetylase (PgdA/CDA1 family)
MFWVSRVIARRGLRIIGCHRFETVDEGRFRKNIFMQTETVAQRLDWLVPRGYAILPLGEAVERLERGDLPLHATVRTFDDVSASIWTEAIPLLRARHLPATIYVTTYYCLKGTPIFRLAPQYMSRKSVVAEVCFSGLGLGMEEAAPVSRETLILIRDHGEAKMTESERVLLCKELARRLEVDFQAIVDGRYFSIITPEEIYEAPTTGVDIQLHTHRHLLPEDRQGAARELTDCRAALEPLTGRKLDHLCYPATRPVSMLMCTSTSCEVSASVALPPAKVASTSLVLR